MRLAELCRVAKGSLYGDGNFEIRTITPPKDAQRCDVTFLFDASTQTRAGAVIAVQKFPGKNGIVVDNPKEALYRVLKHLARSKRKSCISGQAIIDRDARVARSCIIEPCAVIKQRTRIGKGTYIGAHCSIDEGVIIGHHCEIHPHCVIHRNTKIGNHVVIHANSVIGTEGFGFVKRKRYERLRHIGWVRLGDFVEIGSCVTVDRGTIGATVIGEGTKIDNQVHIAHNVKVGKHCIIMGQVGIAGSTTIGNNVTLCGQVGVRDHLTIGDNVIVYAKSGVFKPIAKNAIVSGTPAREHATVLRAIARLYKGL